MNRETRRREFRLARPTLARRASWARHIVVLFTFVAIAIQSFVVQTHIHRAGEQSIISFLSFDQATKAAPTGKRPVDKFPDSDDPSNCPICQEFHASGAFVAPTAAVLALPFYIHLSLIVFREPTVAIRVLSHSWQDRAPPEA